MLKSFKNYANQVVGMLNSGTETKRRIREDILELLQDRYEHTGIADPVELLGSPRDFAETLGEEINEYPTQFKTRQSEATFLGIPLFMISNNPSVTAKAWIAIGTKSIGFFSFGAFSIGFFSFGALGFGVFTFGGLAIALTAAFGGVALAFDTALGGIAVANHLAMGGIAVASDVAVGGMTTAKLMAYTQNYISPASDSLIKSNWAFKIPNELDSFKQIFTSHFSDFGSIKTMLIQGILHLK